MTRGWPGIPALERVGLAQDEGPPHHDGQHSGVFANCVQREVKVLDPLVLARGGHHAGRRKAPQGACLNPSPAQTAPSQLGGQTDSELNAELFWNSRQQVDPPSYSAKARRYDPLAPGTPGARGAYGR